jgi:hypothetical protein
MRAILRKQFGGPGVLEIREIPEPEPQDGHAVIQVKAFGLNHAELHMRKGEWAEIADVSGIECVGVVKSCPGGEFAPGTKVAALMGGLGRTINGSYAEYTRAPVTNVAAIESGLPWAELAAIPYGSSAVVALAYPPGSADRLPDATGFIVPPGSVAGGSPTVVTACTWVSRKWPSAAFGDRAVIRAFVGRAGDEAALELSDPELVAAVARDIGAIAPLGTTPDGAAVMRWERSMPQYELGHLDVVDRIEGALARDVPGLFVTGSAYRGVGIADCVRQANEAAARVLEHLGGATPTADADGRRVEAT